MGIGLALGAAAGYVLLQSLRRVPLPDRSLYPLAVLLAAGVIYGIAAVAHGSGFLAVFVAGIVIGDAQLPGGSRSATSTPRSPTSGSSRSSSPSG